MKNTQIEKDINNVFFDACALVISIISMILFSIKTFLGVNNIQKVNKRSKIFSFLNYVVIDWPKDFYHNPSGYKIWRFIGDLLHHIFLKK